MMCLLPYSGTLGVCQLGIDHLMQCIYRVCVSQRPSDVHATHVLKLAA